MPREVLNLGEKRYVESLFTNGKSHLRNDRIKKILIIHSNGICRREVLCMKLDDNGSIVYQLVFGCAQKSSNISTLRLTSAKTDKPSQPLNFHDGRWRIVISEGTWVWLALFSRLCHSIDS